MSLLDWIEAATPILVVLLGGFHCRQYVTSVVDFTAARRSAGRYLLCIAGSELQAGAVVFIAWFESIANSGFALSWWYWLAAPIGILITMTGFIIYRFRETRAMTLAQFFELRYGKSFRVFAGVVGFVAGIFNFGIMPILGAKCVMYFLALPVTVSVFSFTLPTYVLMMGMFLSISSFIAVTGGLITVMVINCLEGILAQISYLIIIAVLLASVSWPQIDHVLSERPRGQSFLNPFDGSGLKDFNIWYVAIVIVVNLYNSNTWQNASGYPAAALTPHEGRMGGLLGGWREMGKSAMLVLMAVCGMTFLQSPDFATQAGAVKDAVAKIPDAHTQVQMSIPIAMAHFLPPGVKGVLCALFLMGIFGGDATHLNSWGSIFVQDVLVPLRKKPFEPRAHLLALRCSIIGVALFAFLFGSFFPITQYVNMWWAITVAIYCGGAGAVVIGGMYWKKGTKVGAWAAMITGSTLSLASIILDVFRQHFSYLPNGRVMSLVVSLSAMTVYLIVSLLTFKEDFNLDRMLHRGVYAKMKEAVGDSVAVSGHRVWLGRLVGIDEDYSLGDKWIAGLLLGYNCFWSLLSIIGTAWYFMSPWPITVWSTFWEIVGLGLPIFFAVVTGIWFTWGGMRDLGRLFQCLKRQKASQLDDGTVVDNQNLDEYVIEEGKNPAREGKRK